MRLRFLFLPLIAALPIACQSSKTTGDGAHGSNASDSASQITTEGNFEMDEPEMDGEARPVEAGFTSAESASQDLSEDAQRIERTRQQRAFLAGESIAEGDAHFERADLGAALTSYSEALAIDPSNQTVRERIQRVEAAMGVEYAVAADALQDEVERELVRRAQARIEAERYSARGDVALAKADYETAISNYRNAKLVLHYHPLIATNSLDEQIIGGKLASAEELAENARIESLRAQEDQARRAREQKELAERRYKEEKLVTLFNEAHSAFLAQNYQTAEKLCDQVLLEDPDNPAAMQLAEVARKARHEKRDAVNRRNYREQWIRTFEDLNTSNVIQTEALVFDDLDRWREVSKRKPLEFETQGNETDADLQAVLSRLEETVFSPNFGGGEDEEGAELAVVAQYLQSLTGVNFIISPLVADLDPEETMINLQLPTYSVRKVLDLIVATSENLRWKVEDGVVKFVTAEEMLGGQILRFYAVTDLIHPIPDFPGRDINVSVSGGITYPDEDLEERESNVVTLDLLDQLVRNNISPESWDADPANSLRINESGVMVVNQTPEVHDQIALLLEDLREATGIMVDIQSNFLQVEDNFLEDIGVDFRGLGQPGPGTNNFINDFGDATTQATLGREIGQGTDLGFFYDDNSRGDIRGRVEQLYDEALGDPEVIEASGGMSFQWTYLDDSQLELILRAVSKSERVELVSAPRILVSNTGRANLTVLNQVVYVKDFDVEIAQGASIADPIIDVIQDGVILDVRPVVSADRRFITLELRPTIATLRRPIRERATTLGSQSSVTIQLPEVDIQRVRTSIPMPDGATVMLGGLKVSENKDYRNGVPIVNKIPIVSLLFERKGIYNRNKKLLILLKASIVIPAEHEPTAAQLGM
jgi:tetratricopeptide (TPR) repeat protein